MKKIHAPHVRPGQDHDHDHIVEVEALILEVVLNEAEAEAVVEVVAHLVHQIVPDQVLHQNKTNIAMKSTETQFVLLSSNQVLL